MTIGSGGERQLDGGVRQQQIDRRRQLFTRERERERERDESQSENRERRKKACASSSYA
jgi:hypothetical protein